MIERKGFQPLSDGRGECLFASLVQRACRPRLAAGTTRPVANIRESRSAFVSG